MVKIEFKNLEINRNEEIFIYSSVLGSIELLEKDNIKLLKRIEDNKKSVIDFIKLKDKIEKMNKNNPIPTLLTLNETMDNIK